METVTSLLCVQFWKYCVDGKLFTFFPSKFLHAWYVLSPDCRVHPVSTELFSLSVYFLVMLVTCLLSSRLCFFCSRENGCQKLKRRHFFPSNGWNLVVDSCFIAYWSAICAFVLTINFDCSQSDRLTDRQIDGQMFPGKQQELQSDINLLSDKLSPAPAPPSLSYTQTCIYTLRKSSRLRKKNSSGEREDGQQTGSRV